jgi:hypothetical protein
MGPMHLAELLQYMEATDLNHIHVKMEEEVCYNDTASAHRLSLLKLFVAFFSPSRRRPIDCSERGHDRFLTHPLPIISN